MTPSWQMLPVCILNCLFISCSGWQVQNWRIQPINRIGQMARSIKRGASVRTGFLKVLLASLLALGSYGVQADEAKDHDRARQALESGEILPLRKILEKIEPAYPGQVLEVELERKHGRWIYELKLLQNNGLRIKLLVNAVDGSVLSDKRK